MIKLKDLLVKNNYYTISYDLRAEYLDTEVNNETIQDILATLLVRHECPLIKCFVETTVHFASARDFEFWRNELEQLFSKYVSFIFEQIQIDENGELLFGYYYNSSYAENYDPILENSYDELVAEKRVETSYELIQQLSAFLMRDI